MWLTTAKQDNNWLNMTTNAVKFTLLSLLWVPVQASEPSPVDVSVSVLPVHFSATAKKVVASGSVRPISEQVLAFKTPGFIDQVLVREGQYVKKGELMATLVLDEIDAQVAKASAVLDDASRQLERITALKGRQLASDERGRQAQTSVQIATADFTIAKFNRRHAVIRAPADGRVLTRHIESHELIQAGQKAFVFADEQQGWSVRLSVADIDVVKLKLKDKASIQLDAYPGQVFNGYVREIAGRSDARSQTFEVDVLLDKAPRLYSGLIAHTQITPSFTQSLAQVPLTALIEANGVHAQIYVLNTKHEAVLQNIKIAYLNGQYAMVSSGVVEGDKVVVQGGPFILDGSAIAVRDPVTNSLTQPLAK
ncbi:MAG: efflux RND transporter periplasmic adaptor subunit [Bermanella sp.]